MSQERIKDIEFYKVKEIVYNVIKTVYVFLEKDEDDTSNRVFSHKDVPEKVRTLFTSQEWDQLQKDDSTVVLCKQRIYPDDSIATIKLKIVNELLTKERNVSIEELYLFTQKMETLNSVAIYQSLTQNGKIRLKKPGLDQFIQNIQWIDEGKGIGTDTDALNIEKGEGDDIYTYDDIFELKLDGKQCVMNKPLGQKSIVEREYPYICNPYDITNKEQERMLENRNLSTLNSQLLLSSGEIVNNTIYLCLASDVLSYADEKGLSTQLLVKMYYPFLYSKNINSLETLNEKSDALLRENKKVNNEATQKVFDTIDMFYNMYILRKSELEYVSNGIHFIKAVMKPDFDTKLPLEVLFKIIHATETNPLIKYNPSLKQENVYRLYADKTATDGRKIPYLKKATIYKLMKTIGKSKSVSVYVETNDTKLLNFEFDENGYIVMTADFSNTMHISQINELFHATLNPIIKEVQSIMEQSGYKINLFHTLDADNVDIKLMTYETNIRIHKMFDIKPYSGCISTVFINETDKFKEGKMVLRFKRVANFSKFNSQEAFILEKAEQGLRGGDIIQELLENFPNELTLEEAQELVRKVANELEVERGARRSDIKIKENPGFKTTITLEQETGTLKIVTENINHVGYLQTLPVYLDSMVRLTQGKQLTEFPANKIDALCNKAVAAVEVVLPDVNEEEEEEQAVSSVEEFDMGQDEDEKKEEPKGAFDLFFDDDDEEDMDDDDNESVMGGGEKDDEGEGEEEEVKKIDGMKLTKPYYFQTLIEKRDPVLILKEDTKEYNSYSRTCLSNKRRQPVVLTDTQLEKINQENPGFLREQDVLKYGSDKKHQNNYICPRYWCLKNNTVIQPEDIKQEVGPDGKTEYVHRPKVGPSCGKVLPKKETKVKPGYYVYEFYDENEEAYPGLIPDKHPDGHCLPCCFKHYNTEGRIKAREKCTQATQETQVSKKTIPESRSKKADKEKELKKVEQDEEMEEVNGEKGVEE